MEAIHLFLITALYAGINGLIALVLAARVTVNRARRKIDIGDGGDPAMQQVIRAHGNNAEYLALILVVMALVEVLGAPALALHVFGVGLTVGRLWHCVALSASPGVTVGRVVGQSLTWLALLGVCLYALYLFAVGGRA